MTTITPADPTRSTAPAAPGIGGVALDFAIVFAPIVLTSLPIPGVEKGSPTAGWINAGGIVASMILATVMLRRRGEGWATMGMGRPKSWLLTVAFAVATFFVVMAVSMVVQVALMLLLPIEPADHSSFDVLVGNLPMLLAGLVSVWITAAFGEEMLMRGFMMNRLAGLFGGTIPAWIAALFVSTVLFGLMHVYQGLMGVIATGVAGFLCGAAYLIVGRNLWVVILAHGFADTLAFVMIYFGLVNTGN
jgi:membrane protease YdiL (CAAX protease family)